MKSKFFFACILLIFSSLFWSGNFLVGKLAYNSFLDPLKLSFYRWLIALIILLPFTLKEIINHISIFKNNIYTIIFLSILSVTIFNSFTYIALQSTMVINASLMASIGPLLIIFFSWIIYKTKTSLLQFIGIILSMIGVLSIILKGKIINLFNLNFTPGDLWMLAAVISWGLYSVFLKKLDSKLPKVA